MVIYTYGHEYTVTSVQKSDAAYDCYICDDPVNGGFCRIVSIKNKALFPELVSWLSGTVDPTVFTDYIEHFIFDDTLCIVMKYTQGVTLSDKLETEAMSLQERLELCRRILERAVLLDIPGYFLDKCIDSKNIIVAPDLSVSFNYPIFDIMSSRDFKPLDSVEKLLRLVFAYELERKVPDELMEFFDTMPDFLPLGMIEVYSRYFSVMTRLVEREAGGEEPKSVWFKIWDKIKKLWQKLKKVLIFVLLAAAVIYFVFTLNFTGDSGKKSPNFDSIGTVVIDKNR